MPSPLTVLKRDYCTRLTPAGIIRCVRVQDPTRAYTDIAIETALALRLLFHLPMRQTEGFVGSVWSGARIPLRA